MYNYHDDHTKSQLTYSSTFTIVFTEIEFTLYQALLSVKIVQIHIILAAVPTSSSLSFVQGLALTGVITFPKFSFTFLGTCLELLLERVGHIVLPTVRVTFCSVGITFLFTKSSIPQNTNNAQRDGDKK